MKICDLRLDKHALSILKRAVHKPLTFYSCQPDEKENSIYQIGLNIDHTYYRLVNDFVVAELESPEEYAKFSIEEMKNDQMDPYLSGVAFKTYPVSSMIKDIKIITDKIFYTIGENDYHYICDEGIVLMQSEKGTIVFEKEIWFSEEIRILHGTDYQDHLLPIKNGWDFEDDLNAAFERSEKSVLSV